MFYCVFKYLQAGKYLWLTYKEVYDLVLQVGVSIRSCRVEQGGRCGICGANCSNWVISMQACNAHGLYCLPLYDTLALVSLGKVTLEQEEDAGNFGVKLNSCNDFLLLGLNKQFDIPIKKITDICTITDTSGTTDDL
ncbi:unnamed protein product [Fraxinus pennsylvanica]|uniref:AMP-dependent synthetase/ligase domain-containing protein n=1 Tax=Fraxinus pennsylvanica TaxID=56036 RepID=A0AAD2ECW0_9LAMI|nr:unnamed protein product [Fraxinus pennsylvanica]